MKAKRSPLDTADWVRRTEAQDMTLPTWIARREDFATLPRTKTLRIRRYGLSHEPFSTKPRQSGNVMQVHPVRLGNGWVDNITVLGRDRVDNMLKAHI